MGATYTDAAGNIREAIGVKVVQNSTGVIGTNGRYTDTAGNPREPVGVFFVDGSGTSQTASLSGGGTSSQTATATGFKPGATVTFYKNGNSTGVTSTANGSGVATGNLTGLANGDIIMASGAVDSGTVTAVVAAGPVVTYLPTVSIAPQTLYSAAVLVSGYNAPVTRAVRRSDSATLTLSKASDSQYMDASGVNTFRGASTLGLDRLYDQAYLLNSGTQGANDATQTSDSLRPSIFPENAWGAIQPITTGIDNIANFEGRPTPRYFNRPAVTNDRRNVTQIWCGIVGSAPFNSLGFWGLGTGASGSNLSLLHDNTGNRPQVYPKGDGYLNTNWSTTSGQPIVITIQSGPSFTKMRVNGALVWNGPASAAGSVTGGFVGAGSDGFTNSPNELFADITYPALLSDADCLTVEQFLMDKFDVAAAPTRNLVLDGDSLTGQLTESLFLRGLTRLLAKGTPGSRPRTVNFAGPGGTAAGINARKATTFAQSLTANYSKNCLLAWMGTNDIEPLASGSIVGADTTIWTNSILPYIQYMTDPSRFGMGGKVIIGTIIPRGWSGSVTDIGQKETVRLNINQLIRDNAATYSYAVADYAAETVLDIGLNANNPHYPNPTQYGYASLVHLSYVGEATIYPRAQALVMAALAPVTGASVTIPAGAIAFYSLVKPAGATKNAGVITRTSDSATLDVSYAADGYADTAAIDTFLGASTGRWSKLYNHGSGDDLTVPSGINYSPISRAYFGCPTISLSNTSAGIPLPSTLSVSNRLYSVMLCHAPQGPGSGASFYQLGTAATPRPMQYIEQNKGNILTAGDGNVSTSIPMQAQMCVSAAVSNGTNLVLHLNEQTQTLALPSAGTCTGGWIGYTDIAPFAHKGDIVCFGLWPSDLTTSMSVLKSSVYAAANVQRPTAANLIYIIDSLTFGSGTTYGMNTMRQTQKLLNRATNLVNCANPGQNVSTAYTSRALIFPAAIRSGMTNVLMLFGGSNDLKGGATGQSIYDNSIVPFVTYALANGCAKVYVSTVTPRNDSWTGAQETERLVLNTLIRNGAATNNYTVRDFCADEAFNAVPDYATDCNNTTYYAADKIHMTNAGYTIHAQIDATLLNTYLG